MPLERECEETKTTMGDKEDIEKKQKTWEQF